jgi:hypothetical protein
MLKNIDNDIIISFICKYLTNKECVDFLNIIGNVKKYKYLYEVKQINNNCSDDLKLNRKAIRHLISVFNTHDLSTYNNLISITFDNSFNTEINEGNWPPLIENIVFGNQFNQRLHKFPSSVTKVKFGNNFNQTISINIFPSIMFLIEFGQCYDQRLQMNVLPYELDTLIFGDNYNKKVEHDVLSPLLKKLIFGYAFNQIINVGVLPNSIETLAFGTMFNKMLYENVLPKNLKHLDFGDFYDCIINLNILPEGLVRLTFGWKYDNYIKNITLPMSLKKLTLGRMLNNNIDKSVLNEGLEDLTLGYYFNNNILYIPNSLLKLQFGYRFDVPINDVLLFNTNLIELRFDHCFNQELTLLPVSLKRLYFGWYFDKPLFINNMCILPDGLEILSLGFCFDKPLIENKLPSCLKILVTGSLFSQKLNIKLLPKSVEQIIVDKQKLNNICSDNFTISTDKYDNTGTYGTNNFGVILNIAHHHFPSANIAKTCSSFISNEDYSIAYSLNTSVNKSQRTVISSKNKIKKTNKRKKLLKL